MSGVSLQSENNPRLCIVGNPENRRVRDFRSTAEQLGFDRPDCVSWHDLLDDRPAAWNRLRAAGTVRLDSPGENDEVLHRLIQLGGGDGRLEFGEIGFLREQYRGFCKILHRLPPGLTRFHGSEERTEPESFNAQPQAPAVSQRSRDVGMRPKESIPAQSAPPEDLARPHRLSTSDGTFQNPPADIETMFDKWSSHLRFAKADIPRPATRLAPDNAAQFRNFRSTFGTSDSGRLFLKPRYASSASGVCAYRWSHGREQLIAPLEIRSDGRSFRLYNSLRVRQYTSLPEITAILDNLLPQDMICERWIRKASLPDGQFDLRVLVIAREARHTVVRQSNYPMTNLHLGNRRGSLDEVRRSLGPRAIDACYRLAEKAANCFPDSLYAGVDVLLPAKGAPMICEINAFGDLLPGLTHRGETAYEAILLASQQTSPASSVQPLAECDS